MIDRTQLAHYLAEIRRILTEHAGRRAANRTAQDVLNIQRARYSHLRKGLRHAR